MSTATIQEFSLRCSLLLWPGTESTSRDLVIVDNIKINLATYQVYIDESPVDLTYMEYLLLSFLATHPSRAYSREALLQRVWGFEYCGGTRTLSLIHILLSLLLLLFVSALNLRAQKRVLVLDALLPVAAALIMVEMVTAVLLRK